MAEITKLLSEKSRSLRLIAKKLCCAIDAANNSGNPVTITINGQSFTTVNCGDAINIIVKNNLGVIVGSQIGGEWVVPS